MNSVTSYRPIKQPKTANAAPAEAHKPGILFEIIYFLIFVYARVLPNFGISAGSSTAGFALIGFAGLILLTMLLQEHSVSFAGFMFPVVISGALWFVVLATHPAFFQKSTDFFISTLGTWVAEAIIITYLSTRPGFIKHLLILMLASALALVPLAQFTSEHRLVLATTSNGFLANSNDFAAWIGFCAVCFIMWAFNARQLLVKLALAGAGILSFVLVALAVSRAPLFAAFGVLGLYIGVRAIVFKRGFSTLLTLLFVAILIGIVATFFDMSSIVDNYTNRLDQDTGRDWLWAATVPLIEAHPAGIGSFTIYDPSIVRDIGPHNAFLYFGLIAGWLPMILLALCYAVAAWKMPKKRLYDDFLWLPGLLIYAVLEHSQSNEYVFHTWSVVTLVLCMLPAATFSSWLSTRNASPETAVALEAANQGSSPSSERSVEQS